MTAEERFVEQVQIRRSRRRMTQTDLARAMSERGFRFHQPTIQRIEERTRPVRLAESYALAAILGSTVSVMSQQRTPEVELAEVRDENAHLRAALRRIQAIAEDESIP